MTEGASLAMPTTRTNRGPIATGLTAAGVAIPLALAAALPGLVYRAGFDHLAYGLGLLAGVVLAGLLIAPRIASAGATSIQAAISGKFGRGAGIIATVIVALVLFPLLTAEFGAVSELAKAGQAGSAVVIPVVALASVLIALFAGARVFAWLATTAYVFLVCAFIALTAALAVKVHQGAWPLDLGSALTDIRMSEEKLLENGLVDFETFSAHVTPFVRLTKIDFVALVLSLALGMAVLMPLVSALAGARRPGAVRFAGAWTALFVMIPLATAPVLAAYAKLEIYREMTGSASLSPPPAWLEAPSAAGLAHIHGTSLAMLEGVRAAVERGAESADTVAGLLSLGHDGLVGRWNVLDPSVQDAVMSAARKLATAGTQATWSVYVSDVLPQAATAAGNDAQALTQAAVVLDPGGLLLALPGLVGWPAWTLAALCVALGFAATIFSAALLRAIAASSDETLPSKSWLRAFCVVVLTAAAAGTAWLGLNQQVPIIVSSLSLAAAGLFPVLMIGLVWRRATTTGAIMAMLMGAGVTLYYDIAIQAAPAAFYRTWPVLSDAGDAGLEEFSTLETEIANAATDEDGQASSQNLEALARGTPSRRGLANWFGIDSASGAVFGVPFGLLALGFVSLLTGRRSRAQP